MSLSPAIYGAESEYESELDSICAPIAYCTVEYSDLVKLGINTWEQLLTRVGDIKVYEDNLWHKGRNVCFFVDGKQVYVETDETVTDPTNKRRPSRRAYDEVCRTVPLYSVKRVYFIRSTYRNLFPYRSRAANSGNIIFILTNNAKLL